MSIAIMAEVWEMSGLTSNEKLVALAIADICGDRGECYPEVTRLAARTGLTPRTVKSNIECLISKKVLVAEQHRITGYLLRFESNSEE